MYGQSHGDDLIDQLLWIWFCLADLDKDFVNPFMTEIFTDRVHISDNRYSCDFFYTRIVINEREPIDGKVLDRTAQDFSIVSFASARLTTTTMDFSFFLVAFFFRTFSLCHTLPT